jgi:hypothetical protein
VRFEHAALLEVDDGVEGEGAGDAGHRVEVDVLDVAVAGQELLDLRPVEIALLVGVRIGDARLEPGVALRVELDGQVLEAHALLLLVVLDGRLEAIRLWYQTSPLVGAPLLGLLGPAVRQPLRVLLAVRRLGRDDVAAGVLLLVLLYSKERWKSVTLSYPGAHPLGTWLCQRGSRLRSRLGRAAQWLRERAVGCEAWVRSREDPPSGPGSSVS